jgi:alkaline phosphatase D
MSHEKDAIVSRRGVLAGLSVASLAAAATTAAEAADPTFTHGVASGDPLQTAGVIWTRAQPTTPAPVSLTWEVSESDSFRTIVRQGLAVTDATRDYTIKVDVTGLTPGKIYFYRFRAGKAVSAVGRTRTWPETGPAAVKLALMSCSNFGFGYFNVYQDCAKRDDIDAVVHVGDYIYEYAPGTYSDPEMEALGRIAEPRREIVSLADYRQRYASYRADPDLQEIHRRHPFVVVWDDHESTNDSYTTGAENHQATEGDWAARRRAATQAYFEWLPIRPLDPDPAARIYRSFEIGNVATLIMLDTRLYGREKAPNYTSDMPLISQTFKVSGQDRSLPVPFDASQSPPAAKPTLAVEVGGDPKKLPAGHSFMPDFARFKTEVLNADRTIMGAEQEAWLGATLKASKVRGVPWQVIGQQTIIGTLIPVDPAAHADPARKPMVGPELLKSVPLLERNNLPLLLDTWGGGYQAARARLMADIQAHAQNTIVLTGDIHNAWSFKLHDSAGVLRAVELVTTSVTSPGFEGYMGAQSDSMAAALKVKNPDLLYAEIASRGYLVATLTPTTCTSEWVFVDTVKKKEFTSKVGHRMTVTARTSTQPMTVA